MMPASSALIALDTIQRQLDRARQHLLRALPPGSGYGTAAAAPNLPVGSIARLTAEGGGEVLVLIEDSGRFKQVHAAPAPVISAGIAAQDPPMSASTTDAEAARTNAEAAAGAAWIGDALQGLQQIVAA